MLESPFCRCQLVIIASLVTPSSCSIALQVAPKFPVDVSSGWVAKRPATYAETSLSIATPKTIQCRPGTVFFVVHKDAPKIGHHPPVIFDTCGVVREASSYILLLGFMGISVQVLLSFVNFCHPLAKARICRGVSCPQAMR